MIFKLFLGVDRYDAFLWTEGAARRDWKVLNFEGKRTTMRTSIVTAFCESCTLEAEEFVAWSLASDWL